MSRSLALVLTLAGCAQASPGANVINPHCMLLCWIHGSPATHRAEPPASVILPPAPAPAPARRR